MVLICEFVGAPHENMRFGFSTNLLGNLSKYSSCFSLLGWDAESSASNTSKRVQEGTQMLLRWLSLCDQDGLLEFTLLFMINFFLTSCSALQWKGSCCNLEADIAEFE